MLTNEEYAQLVIIYYSCVESVKKYRRMNNTRLADSPLDELYRPFFDKYKELVGMEAKYEADEIVRRHYLARWKKYSHEA